MGLVEIDFLNQEKQLRLFPLFEQLRERKENKKQ
jgi:hypothetical protein